MGWNDQIPSAFPLRRRIFFRNQHVGAPKRVQAGQIPSTFAKPWRFFFRNQHANAPKMLWRGQIPSTFAKSWCFFCIWRKRITTLPCKKGCGKVGSPRCFQNRVAFFAFGERESPRPRAKKAVERPDPLHVFKMVLHFLRPVKTDHHAHAPKRV